MNNDPVCHGIINWICTPPKLMYFRPRTRVNTLFSVVKCKGDVPAMHRSCISRLVCIEPPVCYLSQIEHDVILCIHHYCACLSFSGGLHVGERQEAQILKFNVPPPPYTLSLSCPSYSKFSQLSYEPGCSHKLWCIKCATWLWKKYVLIFSKTLFYTHIQRHTAAAGTKCYETI